MTDTSEVSIRHSWSHLSHLQVGRYAEYLVKMEFTRLGFSVFSAEVDDRGIDVVIRKDATTYYDVQVKAVRGFSYIFFEKEKFDLRANNLAAVVVFEEGQPPHLFLISSTNWLQPGSLLVSKDYGAPLKSKPEWGINLSRKNWAELCQFAFESEAAQL
jgi:hypothetical protein